jgi:hypothetical protein
MNEVTRVDMSEKVDATVERGAAMREELRWGGVFDVVCIGPDGEEKWRDTIVNTACDEGVRLAFDTILAGAAYTVSGPFMGLISSVGYTAIARTDTLANTAHGWTEAGSTNAPTYTAPRKTMTPWNAAAGSPPSKALTSALAFAITSSGTIKGAIVIYGAGSNNSILNSGGQLLSAGLFSGGDKPVGNGDTLNVSWSFATT